MALAASPQAPCTDPAWREHVAPSLDGPYVSAGLRPFPGSTGGKALRPVLLIGLSGNCQTNVIIATLQMRKVRL
jgi:hypothetical protein